MHCFIVTLVKGELKAKLCTSWQTGAVSSMATTLSLPTGGNQKNSKVRLQPYPRKGEACCHLATRWFSFYAQGINADHMATNIAEMIPSSLREWLGSKHFTW